MRFTKLTHLKYPLLSLVVALACSQIAFASVSDDGLMSSQDSEVHANSYETELLEIIRLIQAGKLTPALNLTEQHLAAYPKSRVAYLLKADILLAMSNGLDKTNFAVELTDLQDLKRQIESRWRHNTEHNSLAETMFPASLVEMGRNKHVLVADLQKGRLYLYQNSDDGPVLMRDYYMSVGSDGYGKQVEGDNKTPVGIYSIVRYIDPKKLPDLYGDGAFPVNYPNVIDKYRNRTGYGIWLHGTPSDTYARSPQSSEGCFVLSNDDFNDIAEFVDVEERTPVILSGSVDWISKEDLLAKREMYLTVLETWKSDWESLDVSAYLSHYSSDNFNLGKGSYQDWSAAKKATNRSKTFIKIDMTIESLFVYPGEQDMFVVNYTQRYLSNNYSSESIKEQYWQRDESGEWRIIFEG